MSGKCACLNKLLSCCHIGTAAVGTTNAAQTATRDISLSTVSTVSDLPKYNELGLYSQSDLGNNQDDDFKLPKYDQLNQHT